MEYIKTARARTAQRVRRCYHGCCCDRNLQEHTGGCFCRVSLFAVRAYCVSDSDTARPRGSAALQAVPECLPAYPPSKNSECRLFRYSRGSRTISPPRVCAVLRVRERWLSGRPRRGSTAGRVPDPRHPRRLKEAARPPTGRSSTAGRVPDPRRPWQLKEVARTPTGRSSTAGRVPDPRRPGG